MMAEKIRVLYVDDETDLLEICRLFLEHSGDFSVVTAESGPAALDLLTVQHFDAIVSDYQMPEMDGILFLVEVRARFGLVPFILFTGKGREEVVIQAINNGVDFYLQKGGEPSAQFAELSNKIHYAVKRRQTEEALLKSEEKYRQLIENSNEAIVVAQEGMLRLTNRRTLELTGYSEQELLSMPFTAFIHPGDRTMVADRFRKRLEGSVLPSRYIFRLLPKDGQTRWVEISAIMIDWEGRPATLNLLTDVTDRKRAEDALRESEERYRTVVEDQTELICRFLPDGTHVFVNEAYCRYFGLTREKILGTRFRPLIHPEDRERVARLFISLTPDHSYETIEQRTLQPGGSVRWQRWVDRAIFAADGSLKEFQSVGRDITRRKQAEDAMRESEERYRRICEGLTDYMYTVSVLDGHAVATTHGAACVVVTGYTAEEFAVDPYLWIHMVHADDADRVIRHFNEVLSGKPALPVEHRIIRKDGQVRWVRDTPILQLDTDSRLVSYDGVIKDITDMKQAEAALRESEQHVRHTLDALLSPTGDMGALDLADVIDLQAIQSLMNDFYHLTHIGIAIIDLHGNVLVATGWQDICTQFHRVHPETCKNCLESDLVLSGETAPDTFRLYKCRNNMWDIVTPITVGGNHIGNLFLGQFLFDDEPLDYELFRSQARQYGFNEDEYLAALDRVPRWSRATVDSVMNFYTRFAGMIAKLSYSNILLARMVTERDHLLRSLAKSEERYRAYIENSPEGIFITDASGNCLDVNPAVCSMLGYTREELLTLSIRGLVSASSGKTFHPGFTKLKKTGSLETEVMLRKKDGNPIPVILNAVHLPDKRYLAFCTDITERKRAEETMRRLTEFQESVISNAQVWLSVLDGNGTILMWNTAAEEISGYRSRDVIGKNEIWKKLYREKEYRKTVTDTIIRIINDRKYLENFETTIRTKSGTEKTILWNTRKMQETDDWPVNYVAIGIDITSSIHADRARKESENKLNAIVRGSPIPQFVIDKNHLVIHWNLALEGYSGIRAGEIIGTNQQWRAFYTEERPCMADLLVNGAIDEIPQWYEGKYSKSRLIADAYEATDFFPYMGSSGTWLYFTAAPIRDSQGTIIGAVETLEDVTERKQAEQALQEANKKLTLLSGITRHDINNQLMTINGFIDILQMKVHDPVFEDYFTRIITASARISAMIQFTKTYESIGVNAPAWQEIPLLIETAVKDIALGKIQLANDLPAGSKVFADPLIVKVFYNLVDNAVRYGGKITAIRFFSLERNGSHVVVCEDDGEGIPAEEKEKIFERGYGKNTGLGLFLSREILSITGITITETGEPGKGARFEMAVPGGMYR